MTVEADPQRGDAVYEKFYADGGWKYSHWKEYWWHRRHLVKRFNLHRGMRVLEVGCGSGFHTHLLSRMGFDCVGVDRSPAGIAWAGAHYPGCEFHCCDLQEMPFARAGFDVVFSRGLSHYHYDLMGRKAITTTATLMRHLRPGGVFVLVMVSDLSGSREPDKIWQNTLEDFRRHFEFFGNDFSVESHKGMVICGTHQDAAERQVSPEREADLEPAMNT